jgi:hypothetical protein
MLTVLVYRVSCIVLEHDRDSATKVYAGFVVLEQSDIYENVFTAIEESHVRGITRPSSNHTRAVGSNAHRYLAILSHRLSILSIFLQL